MSVRKVSNRGSNIIGRFPSLKLGRMVSFESLIERDFIYWLEFDTAVTWFSEQPLTLSYRVGQRSLSYTPDFHVTRGKEQLLVECKPQEMVTTPDNQRKFAAAQAWCIERGWSFQVVTEVQLHQGYRLQNIGRLIQFARYPLDPALKEQIRACLRSCPLPTTLAEVMQQVAPEHPQQVLIPLLKLAFQHEVSLALDTAPLSTRTLIETASLSRKETGNERAAL